MGKSVNFCIFLRPKRNGMPKNMENAVDMRRKHYLT